MMLRAAIASIAVGAIAVRGGSRFRVNVLRTRLLMRMMQRPRRPPAGSFKRRPKSRV